MSQSDILSGKKVKIVRHRDNRAEYRDVMKDKDQLIEYQREQAKHVFKDCDYIISFVGLDRSQAVLFGVFKVHQYIGSANGKNGIWQRWSNYASNYTGGNDQLIALLKTDPLYYKNFKYSVLQTLPSNITQREIVAIENLYKEKLGSRAHGLNQN